MSIAKSEEREREKMGLGLSLARIGGNNSDRRVIDFRHVCDR